MAKNKHITGEDLTKRERQALHLISLGHASLEASRIMNVKKRTVDFHLLNAYDKLGAANRVQAINKARELGIVQ